MTFSLTLDQLLDIIGTLAFAISGIRLAAGKQFDWFGAFVVGFVTAIGGGTLRDLFLGVTPFWMTNPIYIICTGFALGWVIVLRKHLVHENNTWFIFDTIGLAMFNIIGIEKTLQLGYPVWTAVLMGTLTGVAGGVMRDVLIGELPLIFRKDIYATACVLGGLVFHLCLILDLPSWLTALLSGIVVVATRLLSVRFRLRLPQMKE